MHCMSLCSRHGAKCRRASPGLPPNGGGPCREACRHPSTLGGCHAWRHTTKKASCTASAVSVCYHALPAHFSTCHVPNPRGGPCVYCMFQHVPGIIIHDDILIFLRELNLQTTSSSSRYENSPTMDTIRALR